MLHMQKSPAPQHFSGPRNGLPRLANAVARHHFHTQPPMSGHIRPTLGLTPF